MTRRHLSDDRLIELCLGGAATDAADAHLLECAECRTRRDALLQILSDVDDAVAGDADMVFTADRLARQHSKILHRVEQEGRPGRLLAFPTGPTEQHVALRSRQGRRWVAAAAAAGLVVGLLAEQLLNHAPGRRAPVTPQVVANESGASSYRAVSTTMSDDEFLGQIEDAIDSAGPQALRPLDALTPRAWEVR